MHDVRWRSLSSVNLYLSAKLRPVSVSGKFWGSIAANIRICFPSFVVLFISFHRALLANVIIGLLPLFELIRKVACVFAQMKS